MKLCNKCKQFKDESMFYALSKRKDGLQTQCKSCHNNTVKTSISKNPEKYKLKRDEWKNTNRFFVLNYFKEHNCVDCGESNPVVLDFDHVSNNKLFNIGSAMKRFNLNKIKDEISKCEVRCSNCHRIMTAKRNKGHWFHKTKNNKE